MTNSIWKTPDQKPDVFKPHTIMVVYEAHDEAELMLSTQYETYTADRYINRWCYLDELLAQADKAKRLEEENEAMREEFEVWHGNHKCVVEDLEIARKALEDIDALLLSRKFDITELGRLNIIQNLVSRALKATEHKVKDNE